ncbi:hypothetical protein TeGR_g11531 [Tetraparma gracilis]|uniref:Tetratricopeptide repeat protein 29 n=1 Tax=Tetraparma gracilis TaxID=2962635 RepID=A0ABQ6MCG6_9STRA|nr:hypothetical protein TeGR_g11531 [Tetraparma gracilis]
MSRSQFSSSMGAPSGPAPMMSTKPPKKSRLKRAGRAAPQGVPVPAPKDATPKKEKDASATAAGAEESASPGLTKRGLCESILVGGSVQSFVDFFYLTHRPDPRAASSLSAANATPPEIDVSGKEMSFIRDNLTTAEESRRKGDIPRVYNSYSNLALYFQSPEVRDPKTGVYFYEKCLEISKLTGDATGEMAANHSLGVVHQQMGHASKAGSGGAGHVMTSIQFHERHMHLAREHKALSEMELAAKELVKVYREYAEEKEREGSYDQAVEFYSKGLEAARASRDRAAEGVACHRLGKTYVAVDQAQTATNYLHEFERICKDLDDLQGQGSACAALAAAYQSIGDDDKAVQFLETYLAIASKTENLTAHGEACCALGVIHNKRGEYQKAVEHFEKNFEIARSILSSGAGETSLVDASKVFLGMARGNLMLGGYFHAIQFDIKSLLHWKNTRAPLPPAA